MSMCDWIYELKRDFYELKLLIQSKEMLLFDLPAVHNVKKTGF